MGIETKLIGPNLDDVAPWKKLLLATNPVAGLRFESNMAYYYGPVMSDKSTPFADYERRFAELVGNIEPGQYGKFRGRLVCRLDADQFAAKRAEYDTLGANFSRAVEVGDTIDETVVLRLRGTEVELVMEKSAFFPS